MELAASRRRTLVVLALLLALTAAALITGLILVRSGGGSLGGTLWESYRVTPGGLVVYTLTSPCGEVSDVDVTESDDRVEVTVHVDYDGLNCEGP